MGQVGQVEHGISTALPLIIGQTPLDSIAPSIFFFSKTTDISCLSMKTCYWYSLEVPQQVASNEF